MGNCIVLDLQRSHVHRTLELALEGRMASRTLIQKFESQMFDPRLEYEFDPPFIQQFLTRMGNDAIGVLRAALRVGVQPNRPSEWGTPVHCLLRNRLLTEGNTITVLELLVEYGCRLEDPFLEHKTACLELVAEFELNFVFGRMVELGLNTHTIEYGRMSTGHRVRILRMVDGLKDNSRVSKRHH